MFFYEIFEICLILFGVLGFCGSGWVLAVCCVMGLFVSARVWVWVCMYQDMHACSSTELDERGGKRWKCGEHGGEEQRSSSIKLPID